MPDNSLVASKGLLASLLLMAALVIDGVGIWMSAAVGNVEFFDNAVVWLGLIHAGYCIAVAAWILMDSWTWKAQHFGAASMAMFAPGYFCLSAYLALTFHSEANFAVCALLAMMLVLFYGYLIYRVVARYRVGLQDSVTRELIYPKEATFFRYAQQGDVYARRKRLAVQLEPQWQVLAGAAVVCVAVFFYREPLANFFGTSLLPLLASVMGFAVGSMFFVAGSVCVFVFFIYPAQLQRQTGLPVYVDLLAPTPRSPRRRAR